MRCFGTFPASYLYHNNDSLLHQRHNDYPRLPYSRLYPLKRHPALYIQPASASASPALAGEVGLLILPCCAGHL
jgi:hypothetical protein